jgi:molecular chaperone DnaK
MVKDAEQFAEEDKKRRAAAEAKNNAESLIHATESQLNEHGSKIDAELKAEIEAAVAATKTAVEGGNADEMAEKTQALSQAAMKMGQKIYEAEQAAGAAAASGEGEAAKSDEDVVDAEFSEVDDTK